MNSFAVKKTYDISQKGSSLGPIFSNLTFTDQIVNTNKLNFECFRYFRMQPINPSGEVIVINDKFVYNKQLTLSETISNV